MHNITQITVMGCTPKSSTNVTEKEIKSPGLSLQNDTNLTLTSKLLINPKKAFFLKIVTHK